MRPRRAFSSGDFFNVQLETKGERASASTCRSSRRHAVLIPIDETTTAPWTLIFQR